MPEIETEARSRRPYTFRARGRKLELGPHTRIMGVVNITPDSFSDGGRYLEADKAVERCLELVEEGADLLDLGGESSRPGARPVSARQEQDRVLPVLEAVRGEVGVLISVDTYKAQVAAPALEAGADLINDISAFRLDPEMPNLIGRSGAGIILMHMRGEPRDMQQLSPSPDILEEIRRDLGRALDLCSEAGVSRDRIILDPGIGFGKTLEDNCLIINELSFLFDFDLPLMIGPSRKSFLGTILKRPPGERLMGTAASVAAAIVRGAHLIRVHDVARMREVARVADCLLAGRLES